MAAAKGTAQAFVESMRKKIGTTEHPPGSNVNAITAWYPMNGQPWCDMTVSWAAFDSGTQAAVTYGGKFAYTVAHASAGKNHGDYHVGTSGIRAADVLFYQWEGGSKSISKIDHVGVVEYVSGNTIHTIEGNRGDKCGRFTVVKGSSVVSGYIRPRFTGAASAANKEDEEMAERISLSYNHAFNIQPNGKQQTLRFDKVNQDTGGQRAKGSKKLLPGIVNKPAWVNATLDIPLGPTVVGSAVAQVRFIKVNPSNGKITQAYLWEEIIGTPGDTGVVHSRNGIYVGKNEHLYAQVCNLSGKVITGRWASATATYKEI